MKRFILLLVMLAIGKAFAAPVPVQTAQTVAISFFKTVADSTSGTITATLKYTKTETDGTVDFYVFDISPSKGFVIISGEDIAEPILGYSTESNFQTDIQSGIGLADWIENSAIRINTMRREMVPQDVQVSALWNAYATGVTPQRYRSGAVTPLLKTTWNQEPYYNQLCPFNSTDNQRCVTGCVATAMAQIMKYWNYPTHGTGSHSYTDAPPYYSHNYGAQSANFGTTTYNWANMTNSLNTNNTDIATLMYHCGVSVNMDYGDDKQGGSGAAVIGGNPSAQYSYVNYFSYNGSTIKGVTQSSYTAAAWITLLQGELNAGRPIQYMGFESGVGGHTWVCDGYDANNLFHMNWGWGGYDNGYFSLSNLNPNPYVFNSNDAALIGIQPSSTVTCSVPMGLSTINITINAAKFNWTAVSGALSYNVQYRKVGTSTWTSAVSSTNSYSVAGLASATNYEWQVQTACSASSTSAFSASGTFTTLQGVTCGVPGSLKAGSIANATAALSWASTSATNYNLQWKTTAASNWTTVSGLTATSYTLTGLAACTGYQFQVQGNCSGSLSSYSAASSFTTTGCVSGYCTSKGIYTTYEYINKVSLGSINSTSGDNKGYADFTAQSTSLAGGSTVAISLTPGFHGSAYGEYWTVYIDYNHNGTFTDAGEKVTSANGTGLVNGTFIIPATALNGTTRLRVQMQYGGYQINPCYGNYSYGEVEDYTVNITGNAHLILPDSTTAEGAALTVYPNPAQDNLTMQFTSANTNNVLVNIYNLVGQKVLTNELPVTEGLNTINLNTTTLEKGVYIIETNNNGSVARQKFIIAR